MGGDVTVSRFLNWMSLSFCCFFRVFLSSLWVDVCYILVFLFVLIFRLCICVLECFYCCLICGLYIFRRSGDCFWVMHSCNCHVFSFVLFHRYCWFVWLMKCLLWLIWIVYILWAVVFSRCRCCDVYSWFLNCVLNCRFRRWFPFASLPVKAMLLWFLDANMRWWTTSMNLAGMGYTVKLSLVTRLPEWRLRK